MRTCGEVQAVLALAADGLNNCEISRRTGVPRGTVKDWVSGQTPRRFRRSQSAASGPVCPDCGADRHDPRTLPQAKYAYLLGLYLGDGCISTHRRRVFRLRISLDAKYPGIISECAAAMHAVLPVSKVNVLRRRDENCFEVSSFSKVWPCLFPQHGPGVKHERPIRLAGWQEEIVEEHSRELLRGHPFGWLPLHQPDSAWDEALHLPPLHVHQ
jgi:hypothetical protein